MSGHFIKDLIDKAASPYRSAGRFAWHFARGKLKGDPVFAGLLEHGVISGGRILDIGCGQGLLASWLLSAKAMHDEGNWPDRWPAPPKPVSIHGIELMPRNVERAKKALGSSEAHPARFNSATFEAGDMCRADFGKADTVVILDVLHYVSIQAQDEVLRRVRDALAPAGTLILRVGDANGGLPFKFSIWVDQLVALMRGHFNGRLYCRPLPQWKERLTGLGFKVDTLPMSKGTPFTNMLLIARLDAKSK